jgi:hypothetical protein
MRSSDADAYVYANSNIYSDSNGNVFGYANSNIYPDSNGNVFGYDHAQADAYAAASTDATAATHPATTAVSCKISWINSRTR